MLCTRPVLPPAQQHAGGAASQNEGNGEPQRCEHRGEKICSACYKNGRRPVCTADNAHAGALKIKKQKGKNGKQCCSARQYRRNEEHPAPGAAFGKKLILHFLVKARGNLLRRAHLRDDRIDALSFFQPGVDIGADVPVDARFCFQRQAQLPLDGIDIALDLFLLFRHNCSSLSNPSTQSAKARHALRCTA